jgi:hypothetical protein
MRYALIDENGSVTNIVIWDGISDVQWPDGCTVVLATLEHESEWNSKYVSSQSNQTPLTDEETELLRSLLNRINANGN